MIVVQPGYTERDANASEDFRVSRISEVLRPQGPFRPIIAFLAGNSSRCAIAFCSIPFYRLTDCALPYILRMSYSSIIFQA